MKLSRREAIKTAAAGVGAVAAAAVLPALPAAAEPVRKYLTVLPSCPPAPVISGGFLVPKEFEKAVLEQKEPVTISSHFRSCYRRLEIQLNERPDYSHNAVMKRLAHAYLRAEERLI